MPSIQIKAAGVVRSVVLDKPAYTLGRDPGCDLPFPEDGGLSRLHMMIERKGDSWTVRDLNSKNGTLLNGQKLASASNLVRGDVLHASRVTITFDATAQEVVFEQTGQLNPDASHGTVVMSLKDVLQPEKKPAALGSGPARALLDAGRELVAGRPLPELFQTILKLSRESVGAERAVLLTLEDGHLVTQASSGGEFRISSAVRDKVIQERASMLIQNVFDDALLQKRESIVHQGVLSLMAVPLQTEDRVIGLIYVDAQTFRRQFTADDLGLLTVMANVAAIRIERARLALVEQAEERLRVELDQAAEIQRRHLPSAAPSVPGFEVAGITVPCRTVGGDYFDFLQFADGRHILLVADVAGKGMPASLLMMGLQARMHVLAGLSTNLAEFVTRVNSSLVVHCPRNRFVTMFICAVDAQGNVSYCNAGHNPPVLLRTSGETVPLATGGPPLGILKFAYPDGQVQMAPGDLLVLYSDGITEAESPENVEFDVPRLLDFVRRKAELPTGVMIDALLEEVNAYTCGAPASDDRTILIARRTAS